MDINQLRARLGRNGQAIVAGAILMLIDSFFGWYGLSGGDSEQLKAMGVQTSVSGWSAGFGAWFPVLLILAVAAVAVLGAMGTLPFAPLMIGFLEAAGSVLAVVILLLRWMTYPTASGFGASVGALWGTYVGVVLAVVVAVFAYLDFVAKGGDIKNLPAVFKGGPSGQLGQGYGQQQYNPGQPYNPGAQGYQDQQPYQGQPGQGYQGQQPPYQGQQPHYNQQ